MLIAEEVDRATQRSRVRAFLRMLTLAEWIMGLLCLVIAAIGAAGVFFTIQGTSGVTDLMAAAERDLNSLPHSSANTRARLDRPGQVAKPAQNAKVRYQPEQRAWVEIGNIDRSIAAPGPLRRTQFKYGFYPRNVGKSIAHDVLIMVLETTDSAAFKANQRAIKMRQDQLFFEPSATRRGADQEAEESLAAAQQSAAPVYAIGREPKRLSGGFAFYSYILGRIDYIDVFGTPHWTHFCFLVVNAQGELSPCDYGNDKDNFSEPAS